MNMRVLLAVAAVIAAAAGFHFLARSQTQSAHTAIKTGAAAPGPERASGASTSDPATGRLASVSASLPPMDARVALIYDSLKQRADAGDAGANCRLSFELTRCWSLPQLHQLSASFVDEAAVAPKGSPEERAIAAQSRQYLALLATNEAACEGFHAPDQARAWPYLLAAAQSGHVPSIMRFVTHPPLSETRFIHDLEGWQAYKRHAPILIQDAVRRGSPHAAFHLFQLYAGVPAPGGAELVKPNPQQALTYAVVAQKLADTPSFDYLHRRIHVLKQSLSIAQQQQAQAAAERIFRQNYGGQSQQVDLVGRGVAMTPEECGQP